MADPELAIRPLRECPEVTATLAMWFKKEWSQFFTGRSETEIAAEFFEPAQGSGALPAILVAFSHGAVCGTVALRTQDLTTHQHLSPWAGGLFVEERYRRRGVATSLIQAIAAEAQRRNFRELYAGTGSAGGLLTRLGWEPLENVPYHGEHITVYRKCLAT